MKQSKMIKAIVEEATTRLRSIPMLLIDGYNLIFLRRKGGNKIEAEELKKLRDDLIWKLNKYADKKKATVIVVFDSSEEDYLKNSSRKKEGRVEVIYTSKEISADKMIIDIVNNSPSPSNYSVVTSDSAIGQGMLQKRCQIDIF